MYIDLLILVQIDMAPKHGYEIKRSISQELGHLLEVNHNLLYPALKKFTDQGAITKEVRKQEGRPDQHIYRITEQGKEKISQLITNYLPKDAKNETEFLVRVSLFDRIEITDRIRILDIRAAYLNGVLASLEQKRALYRTGYIDEIVQYSNKRILKEIEWIDKLRQTCHSI